MNELKGVLFSFCLCLVSVFLADKLENSTLHDAALMIGGALSMKALDIFMDRVK